MVNRTTLLFVILAVLSAGAAWQLLRSYDRVPSPLPEALAPFTVDARPPG